eukprot:1153051-Pelagomonas_calceolata.AAC.4
MAHDATVKHMTVSSMLLRLLNSRSGPPTHFPRCGLLRWPWTGNASMETWGCIDQFPWPSCT